MGGSRLTLHGSCSATWRARNLAKARLLSILQAMPRTTILNNDGNYIQTEMRTALMGYVDDVEFFLDEASQTIQFRSASRIGYGDMGMNRKRMEEIRGKFGG